MGLDWLRHRWRWRVSSAGGRDTGPRDALNTNGGSRGISPVVPPASATRWMNKWGVSESAAHWQRDRQREEIGTTAGGGRGGGETGGRSLKHRSSLSFKDKWGAGGQGGGSTSVDKSSMIDSLKRIRLNNDWSHWVTQSRLESETWVEAPPASTSVHSLAFRINDHSNRWKTLESQS